MSGRRAACGWAVAQLDFDQDEEPFYSFCGTTLAELKVQRTINRAELWTLLMACVDGKRMCWPKQKVAHLEVEKWEVSTDCTEFWIWM